MHTVTTQPRMHCVQLSIVQDGGRYGLSLTKRSEKKREAHALKTAVVNL